MVDELKGPGWWNSDHDATLVTLSYDWKAESLVVAIELSTRPSEIVCEGVTLLRVPQEKPWGPSISINGVDAEVDADGIVGRLNIEMQSGDQIEILAQRCYLVSSLTNPLATDQEC